jgi:2-dehydro-3-deoxyglucarate aldolase/4-hydroxy-2-oxoheptanedioate aldolase
MGHIGNIGAAPVQAAIADVAARCRKIGIPCGIVGPTPEMVATFVAAGYDFVAVASDMGMMMRQAAAFIEAIRPKLASGFNSTVY